MMKLVSLRLETKADKMCHVCIYYSTVQQIELLTKGNSADRAGRHRFSVAKYTVLPSFVSICKLLRDL
jgi:hypothetical protein